MGLMGYKIGCTENMEKNCGSDNEISTVNIHPRPGAVRLLKNKKGS
jgi:hypothetical protein